MPYPVSEIIEDLIPRMGIEQFKRFGEVMLLRKMNHAYKAINQENQCCHKEFDADWSQYTASTLVDYVDLPDDWIKPYSMTPWKEYRAPSVWKNDEDYTYTIDFSSGDKRVYVANAATDSLLTFRYYSMGLTLVNSNSPASTEANEPEWPEELKQLLYFETLLQCGIELNAYEVRLWERLTARMASLRVHQYRQATGPNVGGEIAKGGRLAPISDPYTRTT